MNLIDGELQIANCILIKQEEKSNYLISAEIFNKIFTKSI